MVSRLRGVFLLGVVVAGGSIAAAASSGGGASRAGLFADASQEARALGRPVAVESLTTETTEVSANPNGSFTLRSDFLPVRTRLSGEWRPVDPTLERKADGRFGPRAGLVPVLVSGGGGGPLVEMVVDGQPWRVSWVGSLPVPRVQGNSAVYADVVTDVDLVVSAEPDGVREVLVVKSPAGLARLRAVGVRFGFDAPGFTLGVDGEGRGLVRRVDGSAASAVLSAAWWDSGFDRAMGPAPSASDPGGSARRSLELSVGSPGVGDPVGQAVLGVGLGPGVGLGDVEYPLYIDPALVKPRRNHWLTLTSANWRYYDDLTEPMRVGKCGFSDCGGMGTARSYFSFVTTDLTGQPTTANVVSAMLYATQIHSATCTNLAVDLYGSGAFTNTTSWPGPIGSKLDSDVSSAGATCPVPSGIVRFNAQAVKSYLQTAANNDATVTSFVLRAPDESSSNWWKKFAPDQLRLEVTYNFPPNKPTGLTAQGVMTCGATRYTDKTPRLQATVTDNNVDELDLRLVFSIASATPVSGEAWYVPPGGVGGWDVPAGQLGEGGQYSFSVKAFNLPGDNTSLGSADPDPSLTFTVVESPPASAPAVTWDSGARTVRFTNPSGEGVTGYSYSWFDTPRTVPTSAAACPYTQTWTAGSGGGFVGLTGGVGVVAVPASLTGPVTVNVRAFNAAGNLSSLTSYSFVAP